MSAEATANGIPHESLDDPTSSLSRSLEKILPTLALAVVRGGAIALQFASQIVVGLLAGASGLGILQLITSWTCIAGEVIALGLPARAMRRIAVDYEQADAPSIQVLLRASRGKIIAAWLLVLAFAALIASITAFFFEPVFSAEYLFLGFTALMVAPLFSLMKLYAESLKATEKTLMAIAIESLTSPIALLVLCLACWSLNMQATTIALVITFALSLSLATLALRVTLNKAVDELHRRAETPLDDVQTTPQHTDLFFLWSSSVLSISFMHLPFLLMPVYMTTAEIGVFSIAFKMVNVITTLLLLLAAVYGPAFARAAAQSDTDKLNKILKRTQGISTAVFIPSAVLLITFANPLASLFGKEFENLQWFLLILCAGQLINAVTGLSGVLLNMSGAASRELIALTLAIGLAVVGSFWAGPKYGATGLALIFSASIAIKNIASYYLARRAMKLMRTQT